MGHAIAPQSLAECPTAILTALVGVKQHTRGATSLLIDHLQRFDCQFCIRLVRHYLANDPPSMEVEHCGQVMPTTSDPDVGNIPTPHLIGLRNIKFAGQQIGNIQSFRLANLITVYARRFGCQPGFLHQVTYFESTNLIPQLPHHRHQGTATCRTPALFKQTAQLAALLHALRVNRSPASQIIVKTGSGNIESAADQGDRGLLP
ncbi:Protein of uncharacterised function (DUF2699) [Aeromonas salmonicida]|nr:Protein of uncharacterised function (DUF2699) [Aeromonas salmonicida]